MKPICILSPPRSGSTFLNQILDETCGKEREGKHLPFSIPNAKCALIENDCVNLTVSLIMAIETDFYRLGYGEAEVEKYENLEFPPYDVVRNALIKHYSLVRASCHKLKQTLIDRPHIVFTYEEISQTPRKVVETLLEYSDFDGIPNWQWEEKVHIFKLNHLNRDEYVAQLQEDIKTLFV